MNMDTKFENESEYETFLNSISPPKELICPITQELYSDPVVWGDGNTYEREAILRWINLGRTRSPVTNAYIQSSSMTLHQNLCVSAMVNTFKERMGLQLLEYCERIVGRFHFASDISRAHKSYHHDNSSNNSNSSLVPDDGVRLRSWVEVGADLTLKSDKYNESTAFMLLITAEQLELAQTLFTMGKAPVIHSNLNNQTAASLIEKVIQNNPSNSDKWSELLGQVKSRIQEEITASEERDRARTQANVEYRQQQSSLAEEERARSNRGGGGFMRSLRRGDGLGDLEDGLGYFPALATLSVFQSAIPPPSASIEEEELMLKDRLDHIFKSIFVIVLLFFLVM